MNWMNFVLAIENPDEVPNAYLIERIKIWRKQQLQNSDYTQLGDVPIANKLDWAQYRKELRDLPEQHLDPRQWVFPVPPT